MALQDSPALPFEPGDLIAGKYRVDRLLGAGGMGVVVAATHLDLDRPVAVKLIREELAQDEDIVERLMLEAKAAAKIKSNHVGKVLDVGKLPSGVPYIVMELLEGVDLCELLEQDGALPVMAAVDAVLQACEAIAEAHQAQIVHRDLKPENLFVARFPDGSLNIKVLDFGISKQLNDPNRRALTNPTSAIGSPQYMAPEQMRAGAVDERADIWALGAILYELLSNRQAFEGATIPEVCVKVMGQEPPPLTQLAPSVPDALSSVVSRCLSKERDLRFESVAELVEALAPFGSERAKLSRDRVRGLVSGTKPIPKSKPSERPGSAATVIGPTLAGGIAVTVAGTEHWTPPPDGVLVSRNAPRWPVFLGLVGVVLVGLALWAFTRSAESELEQAAAARAANNPSGNPLAPTPLASEKELSAERQLQATAPSQQPAQKVPQPSAAATQKTESAKPAAPPPKKRTRKPAKAVGNRTAPSKKGGSDAWDPDNFGGRR